MKFSKPFTLLCLSLLLLLGLSMISGCASGTAQKAGELTPSTVRAPSHNPDGFWDSIGWTDMTQAEQELWKVLGWNEASWEGEAKKPASDNKYWRQLSDEEKDAATKLGFNKSLWD